MPEVAKATVEESKNDSDETESGTCSLTSETTLLNGATLGVNKHGWAARFNFPSIPNLAQIIGSSLHIYVPTLSTSLTMNSALYTSKEVNAAELTTEEKNIATSGGGHSWEKYVTSWNATVTAGQYNSFSGIFGYKNSINSGIWSAGNNIAILLHANSSCLVEIVNWDGESHSHPPYMEIEWEPPPLPLKFLSPNYKRQKIVKPKAATIKEPHSVII